MAGPLAHPIRPDSYFEISNFYTATIYNKGAEIVRMYATMLGAERFPRGHRPVFRPVRRGRRRRCEDFVRCMEDAGDIDLTQFRLWYSQAGTPRVTASLRHEAGGGRAMLTLEQHVPPTPGQSDKQPMVLPLRLRLFGRDTGEPLGPEQLTTLTETRAEILFEGVSETPALSINRGFSAPGNCPDRSLARRTRIPVGS